jgi:chromosome segregation ATPase
MFALAKRRKSRASDVALEKDGVLLSSQVEDLLNENDSLQGMIHQSKSHILDQLRQADVPNVPSDGTLTDFVNAVCGENDRLADAIEEPTVENRRIVNEFQALPELQEVMDKNMTLVKRIGELENQVSILQVQIAALQANNTGLIALLREREDFGDIEDSRSPAHHVNYLQILTDQMGRLRAKNGSLADEIAELTRNFEEATRRIEHLEARDGELTAKIQQAKNEALQEKEEEDSDRVSHIQLMLEENKRLRAKNDALKAELRECGRPVK